METFLWFIHDSRGNVQRAILEKEKEYKKHQEKVLQDSQEKHAKAGHTDDSLDPRAEPQLSATSEEEHVKSEGGEDEMDGSSFDFEGRDDHLQFFSAGGAHHERSFEEHDETEHEVEYNDMDSSAEDEQVMKLANKKEYFNSLDDILE